MLEDNEPFPVRAGQAVVVPIGAWHSTVNTGWSPMRALAMLVGR